MALQPSFILAGDWQPVQLQALPVTMQKWLLEQGSLTALLREHCSVFELKLLGQQQAILPSEWQKSWQQQEGLCRDVFLLCDGAAVVYAQSWLPEKTKTTLQTLRGLEDRPLGDVIFQHPSLERGPIEVAFWPSLELPNLGQVEQVWGRRSVFHLVGHPFLVQEVFLPGVLSL